MTKDRGLFCIRAAAVTICALATPDFPFVVEVPPPLSFGLGRAAPLPPSDLREGRRASFPHVDARSAAGDVSFHGRRPRRQQWPLHRGPLSGESSCLRVDLHGLCVYRGSLLGWLCVSRGFMLVASGP